MIGADFRWNWRIMTNLLINAWRSAEAAGGPIFFKPDRGSSSYAREPKGKEGKAGKGSQFGGHEFLRVTSVESESKQNTSESYELGWKLSRICESSQFAVARNRHPGLICNCLEAWVPSIFDFPQNHVSLMIMIFSRWSLTLGIQFDPVADQIPKSSRVLHQIPKIKQFVVDCQHFARWERWEGQEWCQGAFSAHKRFAG